jgi:type II secretory pathway component PulC
VSFQYKILNLILFSVVLFAAFMNYETWSHLRDPGKGAPQIPQARLENSSKEAAGSVKETPEPLHSYRVVWERNIFSPKREEFLLVAPIPSGQEKPAGRPPVILHGVVVGDNYQSASVSSPGRSLRKGERETMILKIGDSIGGYRLAKVMEDRITVEAAGDSFEVLLYDPKKPKVRVEVKTAEVKSPEENRTQHPPATLPAVDTAKAESVEKPAEPSPEMAIAAASPSLGRTPLGYSRESRSKRYAEMYRHPGNQ